MRLKRHSHTPHLADMAVCLLPFFFFYVAYVFFQKKQALTLHLTLQLTFISDIQQYYFVMSDVQHTILLYLTMLFRAPAAYPHRHGGAAATGTQFTCFTSTIVRILTHLLAQQKFDLVAMLGDIEIAQVSVFALLYLYSCFTGTSVLALLVQKYKY
jgi:hypothetical protein